MQKAFSLSSVGQYLGFAGSNPFVGSMDLFQKNLFLAFRGFSPCGEGMDLFRKGLFVNNLCLTQKTGRI